MFESIAMSVVAVFAGACLTFLMAILLPEPVAAKGGLGGLYAGLGNADESFERAGRARSRRMGAILPWRAARRTAMNLPESTPRPFNRRRARSVCPARAH
jgi:hypothetical protein